MILRRIYAYVSMESLCRYNIERILFPRVCDVRVSIILIRNSRDRVLFETTMISFSFFFFQTAAKKSWKKINGSWILSINSLPEILSLPLRNANILSFARFSSEICRAQILHAQILLSFPHVGKFLAFTPRWNTTTRKTTLLLPSSRGLALFLRRWKIRRVSKARHIKRSK